MTVEQVEHMAYRLIRKEVNRFDRETSDTELGNYVRGVVDLQTEIYREQDASVMREAERTERAN